MSAEDQSEQVSLFIGQRRQRVDHLLDVSIQVVLIVGACATTSAALTRSCRNMRSVAITVIGATSRTGREAVTPRRAVVPRQA